MQQRERVLLIVAVVAVALFFGLPRLRDAFVKPIESARARLDDVSDHLLLKTRELRVVKEAQTELQQWRARSLPPNAEDARWMYQEWLTYLALLSGLEVTKVDPTTAVYTTASTARRGVYALVPVRIEAQAKHAQLTRFLYNFHRADLAHRISKLSVDSSATEGDPTLRIDLTAEGVAMVDAPPRKYLFPQSALVEPLRSSTGEQTIQLATTDGFPKTPGFRIRIGTEYLVVTQVDGAKWTVRRAADGTSPGRHDVAEAVELAPIHPDFVDPPGGEVMLAGINPFAKPARPAPEPSPQRAPSAPRDRSAEETHLAACFDEEGRRIAWLYRRSNSQKTELVEGSEIHIGNIRGIVEQIGRDHVDFRRDNQLWRLELGDYLNQMRPRPEPARAAEQPVAENTPNPTSAFTGT